MKFKTVPITNFQDIDYNFYYQLIIHRIKVLLLQPDINKEFVFRYQDNNTSIRIYSEQFESEWWKITEKTIPIDNDLLSIIIYADATMCDHLGKISEHSIYISLVDAKAVKEMDHRLSKISHYPDLIILKNGLKNVSKFTANDYCNIMKIYMKLRQESFTDIELAELQTYITEFCQEFMTIFYEYLPSHCKIPKLHVLHYHVILSIRCYGSVNGMSMETYKTLHKSNVKNPYQMTNKKNYIPQMLNTEFNVSEIESKVSQIKQNDDIHRLYKEGFNNFRAGFKEFLTENNITYDDKSGYFKIYSSVAVESTAIIRTAENFYGNE
ncbi:hypothetical protein C1645_874284 [Glomus cerebriforme]|uniref:Uncharacterized protein n=1 Tax=Glomus cerebriforme TaxID=658196 RepID=A0A397T855_9GLOM|nr:hypothetical protein C1645_874284 [Glomus cerebriforme]